VVVGGWDLPEYWIAVLASKKTRNAIALESTVTESAALGWKSSIKKMFLSRVATAFPSGLLHQRLLTALNFDGASIVTGGVGIIRHRHIGQPVASPRVGPSFVFVGRLIPEKNLGLLVEAFNELPNHKLTIVGSGPLEKDLRKAAKENIAFRAHVPNREIGSIYLDHDFLILPSLAEPWGLVVEEALLHGLPVIVSRNVGCHPELVMEEETGLTFDPNSKDDLTYAIQRASAPDLSQRMRTKVAEWNLLSRDERQLVAYERGCAINSIGS
jgi:glycosyltransferase involved in cell wall biosynthesis